MQSQKIKLYDFVEYLVGRVFFIIVFCSPAYFIAEILYTNSNRDGLFVFLPDSQKEPIEVSLSLRWNSNFL